MAKYLNILFVSKYVDKKTGEEKSRWTKCGVAFPHRSGKGFALKLDLIPAGEGDMVMLEPKPRRT